MMHQLLNTLFVTIPNTYVRIEGDTLCVDVEREKKLQVPLHHLGSIVTFGDVMLTPAFLRRCATDGRSVVLLDRNGRFCGRLEGPVSGNILLRQSQYEAATDQARSVAIARACVAGKLRNSRYVLLRGARETKSADDAETLRRVARRLANHQRSLSGVTNLDTLRGLEGDSAHAYFGALPALIRAEQRDTFAFKQRSRRPPRDAFNALISLLYTLLVHDCQAALEGVGLDPQLGFLHAVRPGRPALALDLIEEFRAAIADRLALTLINRMQLTAKHFELRPGGAVYLNDEGRRTVLTAYQQRKQEEITHPLLGQVVSIGLLPHVQARLLARVLRGDMVSYLPFMNR